MSAALTHAAVGILLGLGLRLRKREVLLAGLVALAPDLDHANTFLPVPGLLARGTLTNVFVCLLLPVVIAVAMRVWNLWPAWQRFALATPLILASHIALDMVQLEPLGIVGRVYLFYPLSTTPYVFSLGVLPPLAPMFYSTITAILLVFAFLAGLTLLAMGRKGAAPLAVFAAAWLLLVPVGTVAGAIIPVPAWSDAVLSVETPRLRLPEGAILAVVHNLGGTAVPSGALRLDVWGSGTLVASAKNPTWLDPGAAWVVDVPVTGHARDLGALNLTLIHVRTGHVYAAMKLGLERGHLDIPLVLEPALNGTRLAVANDGSVPAPEGSLRAVATQDGHEVANLTNDAPLAGHGNWTLPAAGTPTGGSLTWTLVSADDGWQYDAKAIPAPS